MEPEECETDENVQVGYEDGTSEVFSIVDAFEHDEKEYVLLVSMEQEVAEGEKEDVLVLAWEDGKLRLLTSEEFDVILPVIEELAGDDEDESD